MTSVTKAPWTPADEVDLSPEEWEREFADSTRTPADVDIDPDLRIVDEHGNGIEHRRQTALAVTAASAADREHVARTTSAG